MFFSSYIIIKLIMRLTPLTLHVSDFETKSKKRPRCLREEKSLIRDVIVVTRSTESTSSSGYNNLPFLCLHLETFAPSVLAVLLLQLLEANFEIE